MKLYLQRYIHHIGGLPDFRALRFTKYNQYESMILHMVRYLEKAGVLFRCKSERKAATSIETMASQGFEGDVPIETSRRSTPPIAPLQTEGTTAQFGGTSDDVFSAICGTQISRFTSSKPSKFAFASDEKSIRQPTTSFVRCCLR